MHGGGGTTTTTTDVPEWLKPYVTSYAGAAQQVFNPANPYPQYPGQQVAGMNPGEQQAIQGITGMASGTPGLLAADQQLGETLSGQGMNNYVSQAVQPAIDQAKTAYYGATNDNLARFQGANRNSSAYQSAQGLTDKGFAQGIGNATAPLYSQEYDAERNRQMQAAGLEPAINDAFMGNYGKSMAANAQVQGQNQSVLSNIMKQFTDAMTYPQQQVGNWGNAISSLTGAGKTQTQTGPGADPWSQGLGLLTMMMFSDRRTKTDVEKVGALDSGLPIYKYRYKGSPKTLLGVMADEALEEQPEAVATHPSGLLMVDYARIH